MFRSRQNETSRRGEGSPRKGQPLLLAPEQHAACVRERGRFLVVVWSPVDHGPWWGVGWVGAVQGYIGAAGTHDANPNQTRPHTHTSTPTPRHNPQPHHPSLFPATMLRRAAALSSLPFLLLLLLVAPIAAAEADSDLARSAPHRRPKPAALAETARWLMHESTWGTLSTISSQPEIMGAPFGNPQVRQTGLSPESPCNLHLGPFRSHTTSTPTQPTHPPTQKTEPGGRALPRPLVW